MTFGKSISTCMRKYATFSGTASISELWNFFIFISLVGIAMGTLFLGILPPLFNQSPGYFFPMIEKVQLLLNLIFLLPFLSAMTRRLHDTGRSGWWLLLGFTGVGAIFVMAWLLEPTKPVDDRSVR